MDEESISILDMQIQDINSEYLGVTRLQLMENAGAAVANHVLSDVQNSKIDHILVLCGTGGNGGDGLVAARHLSRYFNVKVIILGDIEKTKSSPTKHNWNTTKNLSSSLQTVICKQPDSIPSNWFKGDISIIDAILGTGTKGDLREPSKTAVKLANEAKDQGIPIYAIDCPTGVDPSSGERKQFWINATVTFALHQRKPGLTSEACGRITGVNIGIPEEVKFVAGPGDLLAIPRRKLDARKGDSGKILVVGGGTDYTGAPALVALSALRAGADLSIIVAPEAVVDSIRAYSPELIVRSYPGTSLNKEADSILKELISWSDVVVVGPGLGTHSETKTTVQSIVRTLRENMKPTIIDADALKFIKKEHVSQKTVLTPHSGEFTILTNESLSSGPENIQKRIGKINKVAKDWECTFLVKGMWDVITNGTKYKINKTGYPDMAIGGTGDVLSGLTAAFYARCNDPLRCAISAAFINGRSGEIYFKKEGYISPLGVIEAFPHAFRESSSFF